MPPTDDSRIARYGFWRAFAGGNQSDRRTLPRETTTVYNYARTLIRKTASYVFPGAVSFHVLDDTGTPTENNETETLLSRLYSELDLLEFDIAQEEERSIIGDAAEKITWDTTRNKPRVVSVDPASLSAVWAPDDPTRAIKISQTYDAPGWALEQYGVTLTNPDHVVKVTETWTDTTWAITVAAAGGFFKSVPNPYGWIPYLVLANRPQPREFWGESDITDIAAPARELNRALSTLGRILEFSGAPIAVLENVDGTENIAVRPGAKWELPPDSRAYVLNLLEGGGLEQHNRYIDQLRTTLHDISETPRTAFGDTGRELSGTALEIEIHPMVQRVKRKRAGWERLYSERNRRLLDLVDQFGSTHVPPDRLTATVWPPILPTDDDALVDQQTKLVEHGIRSRYTANKTLGVTDPEAELTRIAQETAAKENDNATDQDL